MIRILYRTSSTVLIELGPLGRDPTTRFVLEMGVCGVSYNKYAHVWTAHISSVRGIERVFKGQVAVSTRVERLLRTYKIFRRELVKSKTAEVKIDNLKLPLAPFQMQGVNFLYTAITGYIGSKGAILGDKTGMGKTVEALSLATLMKEKGYIKRCVIVCKAEGKRQWKKVLSKFSDESFIVVSGGKKSANRNYSRMKKVFFIVISYDMLFQDVRWVKKYLAPIGLLIFDEIQMVSHWKARRTRTARNVSKMSKHVVAFSAYYYENNLDELYAVFRIIQPDLLGSYSAFSNRFYKRNFWGDVEELKIENIDELKRRIDPFYLDRRKTPEIRAQIREHLSVSCAEKIVLKNMFIPLSEAQDRYYHEARKKALEIARNPALEARIKRVDVDAEFVYLRQLCLDASLLDLDGSSSKLDVLLSILREAKDKVVVFCFFIDMVKKIYEACLREGIPALCVPGADTPEKEKDRIVKEFNRAKRGRRLVLVSSDVFKDSIDLFAGSIINFDPHWNPRRIAQRVGRIDRIGQKRDTLYAINLISTFKKKGKKKTVEQKMLGIMEEKEDLFDWLASKGKERLSLKEIVSFIE